jgi:hypothetical protein
LIKISNVSPGSYQLQFTLFGDGSSQSCSFDLNAYPFSMDFAGNPPSSVAIQNMSDDFTGNLTASLTANTDGHQILSISSDTVLPETTMNAGMVNVVVYLYYNSLT